MAGTDVLKLRGRNGIRAMSQVRRIAALPPWADITEIESAFFAALLLAHQSTEHIVECGQASGRAEYLRAVARVSAGHPALDSRCAEGWESPGG